MKLHEILEAYAELAEIKYEKEHHAETLAAKVAEIDEAIATENEKQAVLKQAKKRTREEELNAIAKKAKVDTLSNELAEAKLALSDAMRDRENSEADLKGAEDEYKKQKEARLEKEANKGTL